MLRASQFLVGTCSLLLYSTVKKAASHVMIHHMKSARWGLQFLIIAFTRRRRVVQIVHVLETLQYVYRYKAKYVTSMLVC